MRKPRITDEHPWLRYVIAAAAGLLIALSICLFKGVFQQTDAGLVVRYLSDAFLIPGVLLTGIGLLSFLKKEGTYDGLGYTFYSMRTAFSRRYYDEASPETREGRTYFDYKQRVKAKRKVAWHLVIVGGAFLRIAIALTIVHTAAF